ncbi:uncharacterized protein LOC115876560 [Sitophilus oryzae]|uniref:Uncharacterized protein LOC115876560 n=1 Tax=Sitophilus oryzae TaxID=7048 RepID=A0A6J2XBB3_SITOR|nr:uncharacterized protein LOC115876560 [Sitophilus oryzae]
MAPSQPGHRVIQINLNHCEAATEDLMLFMSEKKVDVALVQESWIITIKMRACIVTRRALKLTLLSHYSTNDVSVATCEDQKGFKLLLVSAYMPYDEENPPPEAVRNLVREARRMSQQLVIGCDSNGHHIQWGSKDIKERGESIMDFILSNNLTICNRDNLPTFANKIRQEVLDLTLTTEGRRLIVEDWRVDLERSFSDHRRILFRIEVPLRRGTNPYPEKPNRDYIDSTVEKLGEVLVRAFKNSCPVSRPRKNIKPWWNAELRQTRTGIKKLYNKAQKKKTEESWDVYRKCFNEYKKKIREAKWVSVKEFSESITDTNEAARLRQVLSKEPMVPSNIRRPDNS